MVVVARSAFTIAVAACVAGLLAGCAPGAQDPSMGAAVQNPPRAPDADIQTTCGMLSIVDSAFANALVGQAQGRITINELADEINAIPNTLMVIQRVSPRGLSSEVDELVGAMQNAVPVIDGATFNPDGSPFREQFQVLRDACEANGTGIAVIPVTGAGD